MDKPTRSSSPSPEGTPPPLPPRRLDVTTPASLRAPASSSRPALQAKATTALSLTDIASGGSVPSRVTSHGESQGPSSSEVDFDDSMSVRSHLPTADAAVDVESMLGEVLDRDSMAWKALKMTADGASKDPLFPADPAFEDSFDQEFDEMDDLTSDGLNEDAVILQWKSKLKHFFILSRAGKPIWTRHGNDRLVTSYIGVILTLISFYERSSDELKGFTAGNTRFVIMAKGSLYLVAISRMGESEQQLRSQLDALYMQILSTLTLPVMERMFKARASTDLRRPLQGTEKLLSALADGFTRGSPSTLLSSLECLRMRKAHRNLINSTFLKHRTSDLLYGLIVAGGRLVSVVRPRKHSLHPGDLHLIFNMLFEAGGVKAGGGENWIPLCLPGFNNTGYLYMYICFLNLDDPSEDFQERPSSSQGSEEEVAVILISANKEGFFDLRQMKSDLIQHLDKNGSLGVIRASIRKGRALCTDIMPGTTLRHFLYKSRTNVQFIMPSYEPEFTTPIARRRLLSAYTTLHASMHSRPSYPKIHYSSTATYSALAWSTTTFELYVIAPASTPRAVLAQSANGLVQHVHREEERVFIIGGAVF